MDCGERFGEEFSQVGGRTRSPIKSAEGTRGYPTRATGTKSIKYSAPQVCPACRCLLLGDTHSLGLLRVSEKDLTYEAQREFDFHFQKWLLHNANGICTYKRLQSNSTEEYYFMQQDPKPRANTQRSNVLAY